MTEIRNGEAMSYVNINLPPHEHYLDDFKEGMTFETPGISMSESAIIDFAHRFDPQPFHVDRVAGEKSMFGGLIASGFHTLSLTIRMFTDLGLTRGGSIGSPGIDEVRWLKPVRPGDTIRCRISAAEIKSSQSKPDRGTIRWRFEVCNQRDEVVMTSYVTAIVLKRPRTEPKQA